MTVMVLPSGALAVSQKMHVLCLVSSALSADIASGSTARCDLERSRRVFDSWSSFSLFDVPSWHPVDLE